MLLSSISWIFPNFCGFLLLHAGKFFEFLDSSMVSSHVILKDSSASACLHHDSIIENLLILTYYQFSGTVETYSIFVFLSSDMYTEIV